MHSQPTNTFINSDVNSMLVDTLRWNHLTLLKKPVTYKSYLITFIPAIFTHAGATLYSGFSLAIFSIMTLALGILTICTRGRKDFKDVFKACLILTLNSGSMLLINASGILLGSVAYKIEALYIDHTIGKLPQVKDSIDLLDQLVEDIKNSLGKFASGK